MTYSTYRNKLVADRLQARKEREERVKLAKKDSHTIGSYPRIVTIRVGGVARKVVDFWKKGGK